MKKLLVATFVALLMVGCGDAKDEQSLPAAIPCMACGRAVSKKTEKCLQCGHPTPESVVAFKKKLRDLRIRDEQERERAKIGVEAMREAREKERRVVEAQIAVARKRLEKKRRVAEARTVVARKRQEEERKREEEEREWVEPRNKAKAKSFAERLGLEDYKLILNTIDWGEKPADYTGWVKRMYDNGQIEGLSQFKDGKQDGLWIFYNEDGTEDFRTTYKDGEQVID